MTALACDQFLADARDVPARTLGRAANPLQRRTQKRIGHAGYSIVTAVAISLLLFWQTDNDMIYCLTHVHYAVRGAIQNETLSHLT